MSITKDARGNVYVIDGITKEPNKVRELKEKILPNKDVRIEVLNASVRFGSSYEVLQIKFDSGECWSFKKDGDTWSFVKTSIIAQNLAKKDSTPSYRLIQSYFELE